LQHAKPFVYGLRTDDAILTRSGTLRSILSRAFWFENRDTVLFKAGHIEKMSRRRAFSNITCGLALTLGLLTSAQAADDDVWVDPGTRLMWSAKDNGFDVDWNQAVAYCSTLKIGAYRNWTLPTVDELQRIHDSSADIRGGIKLTGIRTWSSSPGTSSGEMWTYFFHTGYKNSSATGFSNEYRALCVRRPEK
jgi:Protein of unknown function (DUF1566)